MRRVLPRTIRRALLSAALAALLLTPLALAQTTERPGAWLDGPISNWNAAGMAVPTAPPADFVPPDGLCAPGGDVSSTATPEERLLDASGWKRIRTEAQWWGSVLVSAQQSVDGMCRPMQYQWFVFVDGMLAGTLSPQPMDSRTDGGGWVEALRRNGLDAHYSRYAPSDALCCPSGQVTVRFEIERTDAGPVLVPQQP